MHSYEFWFYIDGKKTMQTVNALTEREARQILQAQYPQSRINITAVKSIKQYNDN